MNDNVVREYDYYTLDQAREIIAREQRHNRLVRQRKIESIRKKRRARKIAMLKQKAAGIFFLGFSVLLVVMGEPTFLVLSIPLGIWLLLARKKVIDL